MQYTKNAHYLPLHSHPQFFSTHPLSFIKSSKNTHTYLYDDNGSLITINPTQHKQYRFLLWPRALCALSLAHLSVLQPLSFLLSAFTARAFYIVL